MSDLFDLIGLPYEYGKTDCIYLTLKALERMGIDAPALNRDWYSMSYRSWAKDLIRWGDRVSEPLYDGDVIVCPEPAGFCVVWNQGILQTNRSLGRATWFPLKVYELPLLPYERDLIATLGLSEEEYRVFAAEVDKKLRETDFKGQPTADATTIAIISLVVGVLSTGISLLLAPKPKQQEEKVDSARQPKGSDQVQQQHRLRRSAAAGATRQPHSHPVWDVSAGFH